MKTTPEYRKKMRACLAFAGPAADDLTKLLDDFDEVEAETKRLRTALEAATDALEHSPYANHQEAHDAAVEALHPKEPTP